MLDVRNPRTGQADFRLPVSNAREIAAKAARLRNNQRALGGDGRRGALRRDGALARRGEGARDGHRRGRRGRYRRVPHLLPPGLHHHGQHRRLAGGCAQGVREPQVAGHEHLDADGRDREPGRRLSDRRRDQPVERAADAGAARRGAGAVRGQRGAAQAERGHPAGDRDAVRDGARGARAGGGVRLRHRRRARSARR